MENRLTEGKLRDTTLDGFKRSFEDHSWLLLRKSGTEPLIRVYSDAPSRERAEALVREGTSVLKEALDDLD
jgi:phosphomannomutase